MKKETETIKGEQSVSNTLVEFAATIVSSHAPVTVMTTDELLQEIQKVFAALLHLETGGAAPEVAEEKKAPVMSLGKAFRRTRSIV